MWTISSLLSSWISHYQGKRDRHIHESCFMNISQVIPTDLVLHCQLSLANDLISESWGFQSLWWGRMDHLFYATNEPIMANASIQQLRTYVTHNSLQLISTCQS